MPCRFGRFIARFLISEAELMRPTSRILMTAESARVRLPETQQVRVHRYEAGNDFVIALLCKQTGDQLLFVKLPDVPKTMTELGEAVLKPIRTDAPQEKRDGLLAILNVVIEEETSFSELRWQDGGGLYFPFHTRWPRRAFARQNGRPAVVSPS